MSYNVDLVVKLTRESINIWEKSNLFEWFKTEDEG